MTDVIFFVLVKNVGILRLENIYVVVNLKKKKEKKDDLWASLTEGNCQPHLTRCWLSSFEPEECCEREALKPVLQCLS